METTESIAHMTWICKYMMSGFQYIVIHCKKSRGKKRNFVSEFFWGRGYFVSTIGLDEGMIRNYIKNQEKEDKRKEWLSLLKM